MARCTSRQGGQRASMLGVALGSWSDILLVCLEPTRSSCRASLFSVLLPKDFSVLHPFSSLQTSPQSFGLPGCGVFFVTIGCLLRSWWIFFAQPYSPFGPDALREEDRFTPRSERSWQLKYARTQSTQRGSEVRNLGAEFM